MYQSHGSYVNFSGLVSSYSTLRAGLQPPPNLFQTFLGSFFLLGPKIDGKENTVCLKVIWGIGGVNSKIFLYFSPRKIWGR